MFLMTLIHLVAAYSNYVLLVANDSNFDVETDELMTKHHFRVSFLKRSFKNIHLYC